MKKIFLSLLFLLLVLPSLSAEEKKQRSIEKLTSDDSAQKAEISLPSSSELLGKLKGNSLGVAFGETFLAGKFKNNGDDRISGELYYNYKASYSFDFMANAHASTHKYKGKEVKLKGLALGVKAKFYQFDAFAPFVLGGLGFYQPKETRYVGSQLIESDSKTTIGTHMGFGGDLELSTHFTTSIIFHYHNPFDIKQEQGEKVAGSYYKLLMVLYYNF